MLNGTRFNNYCIFNYYQPNMCQKWLKLVLTNNRTLKVYTYMVGIGTKHEMMMSVVGKTPMHNIEGSGA